MEEEILHYAAQIAAPDPSNLPPVEDNPVLQSDYIQFLIDSVPGLTIAGLRIVVDCANGAAAAIAPQLFSRINANLGADVTLLNIAPNGRNINENCGALHPAFVAAEVATRSADLGLTFDGDADRCMLAGAHRRHPADGRTRPQSPRPPDRRFGCRHHHVQHGT
jgi:phosphoglucosamine mutase